MKESLQKGQEPNSKPDSDRRSRQYVLAGNLFVGFMIAGFVAFMVRNYLQNTLWKDYYYQNAFKFGESCSAKFSGSESMAFPQNLQDKPLIKIERLPHTRGFFDSWYEGQSPYFHAEYVCDFETSAIRIGKGVNYMHLGWLFGEKIEIVVNGRVLLETLADDFVSLPVRQEDLSQPTFTLRVRVSSSDRHRFGFASILPPAITRETKDHLSALAIQPIYEMTNVVQPLIPTLVLGMLIGFTWLIGIRTRIVLTGLFYFACELASGLLAIFGPYLPIGATKVYVLGLPLSYLTYIAVTCLLFEVFGIFRTRIYMIMKIATLLAGVSVAGLLVWDGVFPYSQLVTKIIDPFGFLAFLGLTMSGLRQRFSEKSRHKKNLYTASIFLMSALLFRFANEISRHFSWTDHFSVDFYFRFAMPLYLSGIVLYYLSALEEDLRHTKIEKKHLQDRLNVGSDLLSLVRSSTNTVSCSYVSLEWSDLLQNENLWRSSWTTASGGVMIVQGTLIGGGEQVSLGCIAVYTVLAECHQKKIDRPDHCLKLINDRLLTLFRGYIRTEATAVLVQEDLQTHIVSAGGRPIALAPSGDVIDLGGDILGVNEQLNLREDHLKMVAGMVLSFGEIAEHSNKHGVSIIAA